MSAIGLVPSSNASGSSKPELEIAIASNKKLEFLTWIVKGVLIATIWGPLQGVIPIWGAIAGTIFALLISGLIACFIAFCFMGPARYVEFIKRAKVGQNEALERNRKRWEQRKQK